MNCDEYRSKSFEEHWNSPQRVAYKRHGLECIECRDWKSANRIVAAGFSLVDYPCVHIASHVLGFNRVTCYHGTDRSEQLITYDIRTNDYHIQIDNTQRWRISHCPWCGVMLPESEMLRWYDELKNLGIEDPVNEPIPREYQTDEWRNSAR